MTDSVYERDILDLFSAITEIVDSEPDLGHRARLLGLLRSTLERDLETRVFRLIYELSESGWTQDDIAQAVSMSRLTVRKWLHRYRVQHGIPAPKKRHRLEADLANAIELRAGYKPS